MKKTSKKTLTFYIKFMWYFTWILGIGFAICFSIINAIWYEIETEKNRNNSYKNKISS
jgi:cyd operon protein YbgT